MRMKLRSCVSIDGPGGVMLELGSNKLPGGFSSMVAADAGLHILFQFIQRGIDGLAVCLARTVISADKGRERYGFWGGKRSIPTGTMLDGSNGLSICRLVLMPLAVLDKLLASLRMLAFTQTRKFFRADRSGETEVPGKPAMPLA